MVKKRNTFFLPYNVLLFPLPSTNNKLQSERHAAYPVAAQECSADRLTENHALFPDTPACQTPSPTSALQLIIFLDKVQSKTKAQCHLIISASLPFLDSMHLKA